MSPLVMDTNVESVRHKILFTLDEHPQGLTIKELSELVGAHRQTISKYLYGLECSDEILVRKVGSATLHYIKSKINGDSI